MARMSLYGIFDTGEFMDFVCSAAWEHLKIWLLGFSARKVG